MFDKKFWTTGLAMVMVVATTLLLARIPDKHDEVMELGESVAGIKQEDIPPAGALTEPGYAYVLREYDGHIAVFVPGEDTPQMVLETLVKYLPDYDRSQMASGIPVRDYSELVSLIEDYAS